MSADDEYLRVELPRLRILERITGSDWSAIAPRPRCAVEGCPHWVWMDQVQRSDKCWTHAHEQAGGAP